MKITTIHINAMVTCVLLFSLSAMLVWQGDTCAAVGLAGTIGVVAVHFAKTSNGHDKHDDDERCL